MFSKTFIHSFQFIPKEHIKNAILSIEESLDEILFFIKDRKSGSKIIGLKNIPNDKSSDIYKPKLIKLLNKKKSKVGKNFLNSCNQINICVQIDINFDKLIDYININKEIPSNDLFFLLLRRNYFSEVNQEYSVDLNNIIKNEIKLDFLKKPTKEFLEPTVFKYKNVYFDFKNNQFYLNKEEYNLFKNVRQIPSIDNYFFLINDFDLNLKSKILKTTEKQSVLVICNSDNLKFWELESLNKFPNNTNLLKKQRLAVSTDFFTCSKYKGFFNLDNIYDSYLHEYVKKKRDNFYNSNLQLQLFKWDYIVLADCMDKINETPFLKKMINLLNCKNLIVLSENKKSKLSFEFIKNMIQCVTPSNIPYINFNLLDKYQDHIYYFHSTKKYTDTLSFHIKKLQISMNDNKLLGKLDYEKKLKYISFPNFVKKERYKLVNSSQNISKETCSICLDDIENQNISVTSCGHFFCIKCIQKNVVNNKSCPNCRKKLSSNDIYKVKYKSNYLLLEENNKVKDILNKKYELILTKYKDHLDIICNYLKDHNINCSLINKKKIDPDTILVDNYENLDLIEKNIESIVLLEPLFANDRYYNYQLNKFFKNKNKKMELIYYNFSLF